MSSTKTKRKEYISNELQQSSLPNINEKLKKVKVSIVSSSPPKALQIPPYETVGVVYTKHYGILDFLLQPTNPKQIQEVKEQIITLYNAWRDIECKLDPPKPCLLTVRNIEQIDDIDFYHFLLLQLLFCSPTAFDYVYRRTNSNRMHRFLPILHIHIQKMNAYQSELGDYDKGLFDSLKQIEDIEQNTTDIGPPNRPYTPREFVSRIRSIWAIYC